ELAVAAVHLEIHAVGDHFCAKVPCGHHVYNIEHLEYVNHHCRGDDGERWREQRNGDAEEDLEFVRAVHTGSLEQLAGNGFQGSRQHHHTEARPDPYTHDDQSEIVDSW